ncbi:hypothetical protein COW38_02130, partial [Candidatus Collierbacteria bacterium CG17_big_fil_post_rev_8_21_14_2_50_45_7]
TYIRGFEREQLPYPKFQGIEWEGYPEAGHQERQIIEINGQQWVLEVLGFQGSQGQGEVQMHPEPTQQEDVFFLCGKGEMTIWNGMDCVRKADERNYWEHELVGVMDRMEAEKANYVLAVASDRTMGKEKLVLNVTKRDGSMLAVEAISTRKGHYHKTSLARPSLCFVVKRRPITLDSHEMVGFAGPYSGGSDG